MQNFKHLDRHASEAERMLHMMSKHWERRAIVKNDKSMIDYESCFEHEHEDFIESLLPFYYHPNWIKAPTELKSDVLSWGWIIYNQKTIHIEVEIINPVLEDIILGKIPGAADSLSKTVISETYVDEAYHTFMALNACNIVIAERNLQKIILPNYDLILSQENFISALDDQDKKCLVRLAAASISETMISAYLEKLSQNRTINRLCWMTAEAHRKDELAHANLFIVLMKKIFPHLDKKKQDYYLSMLPYAIRWFGSQELRVWKVILEQINFPGYESMLDDIQFCGDIQIKNIDYSGAIKLVEGLERDVTPYFHQLELEVSH